jgi:Rrf2 family protein
VSRRRAILPEQTVISQTAEYALRAAIHLASHGGEPQTNRQVADATRVSAGYLSKVLQSLGRAGLVYAQRGIGGGFVLSRPARDINVLEVINAVDPIRRITVCPLGLKSHGKDLCPLHRKLDDATAQIEEAFRSTSLADILNSPGRSRPLCEVTVRGKAAAR